MRTIVVIPKLNRNSNYATAIRSAEAFGVTELLFTGIIEIPSNIKRGSIQTTQYIKTLFFKTDQECINYLQKQQKIMIIIIENSKDAELLTSFQFKPNIALIMGTEKGVPLIYQQLGTHVKIPQFGVVNCLNTSIASSIILYERFKQNLKI